MTNGSPEKNREAAILLLFFIALAIHIMDIFMRTGGKTFGFLHPILIPYLLLAFLAMGFLGGGFSQETIKKYLPISILAYIIPWANYLFYYFPALNTQTILGVSVKVMVTAVILLAPAWVIYLLIVESSKITKLIGLLYIAGWMTLTIFVFWTPLSLQIEEAEIPGIQPGMVLGILIDKVFVMSQTVARLPQEVTLEIKQEVLEARIGVDPAQAKTNEANEKQLGVEVMKLSPSSAKFHSDDQVTVYAQVKTETLEQPVTALVECIATSEPIQGTIFPGNEFTVYTSDIQDIDCIFEKGALTPGLHKITLKIDFNFETISYIETFFMTEEKLREMQKREEDPLAGYPQPEATSSKGPVNINIKTPHAPIPAAYDKKITISTVIHNAGRGEIKEIKELYIFVPKGLALSTAVDGRGIYEEISCEQLPPEEARICNPQTTTVYKVSEAELKKDLYKNIRAGREFRMYLEIEDYDKIIGDSPIRPGSFYASMKYDYKLEQSTQIQVLKPITI